MTVIKLHNSKTHKKEVFTPIDAENVRIYLCGPTVYDRAHIGNARNVIMFDVLYRLLRHEYGPEHVKYVRNFTDVDDKINAKAAETGRSIRDITDETIAWYHADMGKLGNLSPTCEPRATKYIAQMIAMIAKLIAKGHAYTAEGHVLFDVRSYPDYGQLSGRSVDDMIAGARVEVAPYKRDPMDFVLWKPSDDDTPGWESPWGRGRPGWHIECSAMSEALLGPSFDIHGGGTDLTFPHHENEVAQSCCANPDAGFANVWLHNEMLQVEGKKMSKSLGNFFTVRDLLDQGIDGEVIRFVFLQTHYRKKMDWTEEKKNVAQRHLLRWQRLKLHRLSNPDQEFSGEGVDQAVIDALANDLNTHDALTILHRLASQVESDKFAKMDCPLTMRFFETLAFLGFHNLAPTRPAIKAAVSKGIAKVLDLPKLQSELEGLRQAAMASKDFSAVDALKASLIAAGVEVRMSKQGVELVPGPDFDAAKLEALS